MTTLAPPNPATVPYSRPVAPPDGSSRRRRPPLSWLRRWPSPLILLAVWQLGSIAGIIPGEKIASPLQILATGKRLPLDGTLGSETLVSVQRGAVGFAIGAVI